MLATASQTLHDILPAGPIGKDHFDVILYPEQFTEDLIDCDDGLLSCLRLYYCCLLIPSGRSPPRNMGTLIYATS